MTEKELVVVSNMLGLMRHMRDHFGYDYPRWQLLDSVIEDAELTFPKEWTIHDAQTPDHT